MTKAKIKRMSISNLAMYGILEQGCNDWILYTKSTGRQVIREKYTSDGIMYEWRGEWYKTLRQAINAICDF